MAKHKTGAAREPEPRAEKPGRWGLRRGSSGAQVAQEGGPSVRKLSRQEFLKLGLGGAIAIGAGAGVVLLLRGTKPQARRVPEGHKLVALPEEPSQNPVFLPRPTEEGGLVLWVRTAGGKPLAHALNPRGQLVWRLCDGRRAEAQIAEEYTRLSSRRGSEATKFLEELTRRGLIVRGGHLVVPRNYPGSPDGPSRYMFRVSPDDPPEG